MSEPLIPADVDLRGLEYMPLFGNHLFGSEFNAAASDSEWRAAMTLWWAAWNQVPAGSLPDDDVALCRLADLGRDVKGWRKLKGRALHGFEKCSDGRLYHAFLCEQAIVAWDKRVKERERKAKWRADQDAKKTGRNADGDGDGDGDRGGDRRQMSHANGRSKLGDVPAEGKGREGTGRDVEEKKTLPAKAGEGRFPEFWTSWPSTDRKVDRKKCLAKWRLARFDDQADEILAHVEAMKPSRKWTEGFEPAPLRYLNGEQWRDGVTVAGQSNVYAGAI